MKNFYEIADTKTINIAINIQLGINECGTYPNVTVRVNSNVLYNGILSTHIDLNTIINVRDVLCVSIEVQHFNKDKHSSVLIKRITADEFEIMPNYNYLASYTNSQNVNLPTSELGLAGIWTIDSKQPLLWWMHEHLGHGWLLHP